MRVIAVGGGKLADGGTIAIDREIADTANGDQALFIPTASGDSEEYIESFRTIYGDRLALDTDVLRLVGSDPSEERVYEAISSADLVYVGGGNTREMLETWSQYGVDNMLKEDRGNTVLSGLSAGAICWFEAGHSDSERFGSKADDWSYITLEALGLVESIIFCPHYDSEDRREPFHRAMSEHPKMVGIGVEDRAALDIRDDSYRAISSDPNASIYRVTAGSDTVEEEPVPQRDGFRPLDRLRSGRIHHS